MKVIGEEVIHKDYILHVAVAFLALAGAGYAACIIQFSIDQLVGASGEQLTFAIYWFVWGCFTAVFLSDMPLHIFLSVEAIFFFMVCQQYQYS